MKKNISKKSPNSALKDYVNILQKIKHQISSAQIKATLSANRELLIMKYVRLLFLIINTSIYSEFLLYKIDINQPDRIGTLSYEILTPDEQEELWKLYESTVYRYQWPTVIRFYNPSQFYSKFNFQRLTGASKSPDLEPIKNNQFSESEKIEYLKALQTLPHGLFDFIKSQVEKKSNYKYSLTWVPTTIFELISFYSIIPNNPKLFIQKWNYINPGIKETFKYYCNTVDKIIDLNQKKDGLFINSKLLPQDDIHTLIKNIAKDIPEFLIYGITLSFHPDRSKKTSLIIEKYLHYEKLAFDQNQFILSRGTNGHASANTMDLTAFDYGLRDFSYGYSLLAGTLFDSGRGLYGAQSLGYMTADDYIGYILLIDIKDFFIEPYTLAYTFALPPLSTMQGLFGMSENFHVRTNDLQEIPKSKLSTVALQLAQYLSKAKLIKTYKDKTATEFILQDDIEIQKTELINETIQAIDALSIKEKQEFDKIAEDFYLNLATLPSKKLLSKFIF